MFPEKNLIIFLALLLFMPEEYDCKFENIEQYFKKYEVSTITEIKNKFRIKFPSFEKAERSIKIKGFGKSFVLDLSIYFHHEDANIDYISQESNSTGRYQDFKALLYQGYVRDNGESYAVGFFTQNNLFRGYFMTDEIYCVEPHKDNTSVIIYKLSDVIFPGCSKTDTAEGVDCSKTKYFEPWKPFKPRSKVKFDYRVWYDKYLQLYSGPGYQNGKNETHTKKYTSDPKGNGSDGAKKDINTEEKEGNSSTVNKDEHDIKDEKHHNDTDKEHGNDSINHHKDHNDKGNKNGKNESDKIIITNHQNATDKGGVNSSEKYTQNKDELGRWLSVSNGNYSSNNEIDHAQENDNNVGKNKTDSDVDRHHEDDDKIHISEFTTQLLQMNSLTTNHDLVHTNLSSEHHNASHAKNETETSLKSSTKAIGSFKETESPDSVSKQYQKKSQGRNHGGSEEIPDPNSISSENFSVNSIAPLKSEDITLPILNPLLYNTNTLGDNLDNFVTGISSLKAEEEEKAFASSLPEKKIIEKRHIFEDLDLIPYANIERLDISPFEMECRLDVLISPSFRKKFYYKDDDAIKDIFTQITLVNKLFHKVVLKRKGMPFHAIFRIDKLVVFKDEVYSPFEMKGEMEDVVRYFYLQKTSCLTLGLTNKILKAPLKFVDGYLPKDEGGACARFGNFFVVSHGDEEKPAPMGLYFAALMRGFTRSFGATDESEKCKKGSLPNPMQILRDSLLTKQITPGKTYSLFTECNIREIETALKERKCLVKLEDPLCGNGILDAGEVCDCGPEYMCQVLDPCCVAHSSADQKLMTWVATGTVPKACVLVPDAQCAQSQPCCDQCLVRPGKEKLCYYGTGPCDMSYCDGRNADCPIYANSSDDMVCEDFNTTRLEPVLCRSKQCDFGLCTSTGLTPCTCASDTGKECLACCLKDGKCQAAVSELRLMKGEDFPLLNGANCTGGLCFRGRCVLEAGLQSTNTTNKNPASMIRSNQVLIALNSLFATFITLLILFILL